MSKLTNFRRAFIRAAAYTSLGRSFVANAGKISGFGWLISEPLSAGDRSLLHHKPTFDCMTVGSGLGLASALLFFPSDRYPIFKRIAPAVFVAGVPILVCDASTLTGGALLMLGLTFPTLNSLSLIFERKAKPEKQIEKPGYLQIAMNHLHMGEIYSELKEAPVFWTSIASALTKSFTIAYGLIGHDKWFAGGMLLGSLVNLTMACLDKTVSEGVEALRPTVTTSSPNSSGPLISRRKLLSHPFSDWGLG